MLFFFKCGGCHAGAHFGKEPWKKQTFNSDMFAFGPFDYCIALFACCSFLVTCFCLYMVSAWCMLFLLNFNSTCFVDNDFF